MRKIHFIGIGGAGMCGIAEILAREGYLITGSDIVCSDITNHLLTLGIKIFFGHRCTNVSNVDVVVISSAIDKNNPEIIAAQMKKIPVVRRAEILSEIMRTKYGIAISGTHGKTTTTAMIISIYVESGLDPTCINGAKIRFKGMQAKLGSSNYLIVEADESDSSFLYLRPMVAVITNIESDHVGTHYKGNIKNLKQAFIDFLCNLPFYGYSVVCIDDPAIREILPNINRKIITYGFNEHADLHILNYYQYAGKSSFTVILRHKNQKIINVILNIPGIHNALNATAAIAVAIEEGISDSVILRAMLEFPGVERRFENLGYFPLNIINNHLGRIMLVDDYGHHPTELFVSIKTARIGWPDSRLVMVFQPHRFTRVRDLYNDFIHVLSSVDCLLIVDVYPAGEQCIIGADSKSLCRSIQKCGKVIPIFIPNVRILSKVLFGCLKDNDLLLVQGAGTIGEVMRRLIMKNNSICNGSFYNCNI